MILHIIILNSNTDIYIFFPFSLTSCVLFIHPSLVLPCSFFSSTMSSVDFLAQEKIWFDKPRYDEAERRFYERLNGSSQPTKVPAPVTEV